MPQSNPVSRRQFLVTVGLGAAATTAAISFAPLAAFAGSYYDNGSGFAVSGYDPVAYFTAKKPTEGTSAFTSQHDGATYRFASAENKAAFDAEPNTYAPQYGGHCAFAVSKGSTAAGDPNAWTVHKGKLYLNLNKPIRTLWGTRKTKNIADADANWPGLRG